MKNSEEKSKICIKCQKCCKFLGVLTPYPFDDTEISKQIQEFYKARGAIVQKSFFKGPKIFLDFNIKCPHLDEILGCLIHETRPDICKNYPEDVSNFVKENCELYKQGLLEF